MGTTLQRKLDDCRLAEMQHADPNRFPYTDEEWTALIASGRADLNVNWGKVAASLRALDKLASTVCGEFCGDEHHPLCMSHPDFYDS